MLKPRIDPASLSHNIDLSLLNHYLEYVLNLEDLDASAKNDILKVIECFKFIKVNLEFIAEAISLQLDFPRLVFVTNKDQQNGVIRDFFHTSIHITNFKTSEQGQSALIDYVSSFEHAIQIMQQHNTLPEFTKKITYDKRTGCLENRTEAALRYCAEVISRLENPELSLPDLDQLFDECSRQYSNNVQANHILTFQYFLPYLNQRCEYNKHIITITHEVIMDYLTTILGQELDDCELEKTVETSVEIALRLTKNIRKKIGYTGMVQFLFPSYAEGQQFVLWLKTVDFLQLLDIVKARCETDTNIVRLNEAQYNALFGFSAYQHLLAQRFDLDLDKPIQKREIYAKEFAALAISGDEQGFIDYINNHTPQVLTQALQYKDTYSRSVLHLAAQHQSPKGFAKLVITCAGEALDRALVMPDRYGSNPLKIAACQQPRISFIQLLRVCSQSALDEALHPTDIEGWNALKGAAYYQSDLAFKLLIEQFSADVLEKALNEATFIKICNNQSMINVAMLLLRLNQTTLERIFSKIDPSITLLASLDFLLIKQKIVNPGQLNAIIETSQAWHHLLLDSLFHHYIKGKSKPSILTSHNVFLSKLNQHQSNPKTRCLLRWLRDNESHDNPNNCYFNDGQLVDINGETLAQQIHDRGLKDWRSLRIVNQRRPDLNEMGLLDTLENNQLISLATTHHCSDAEISLENEILSQLRQGQVVVKIFSSYTNFSKHIRSLQDTNYRIPNFRLKRKHATTKWVHRYDHFTSYSPKTAKQNYLQAQKTSVTLISKKLNTKVFGARLEDNTPCVGLAYRADAEKDKAWLLKDRGTYDHNWIGGFKKVKAYAQRMTDINFTDYSQFQKAVDNQPQVTNEILTHLDKSRVLAVVIAIDTPSARDKAELYRQQVKEHLNLDIPIIFYNSRLKYAYPFSNIKTIKLIDESIREFSWTAERFIDFAKRYEIDKNDEDELNNLIRTVLKKEIIKQIPLSSNKFTGKKTQLSSHNTFFKIPKGTKCILDSLDNQKLPIRDALKEVHVIASKRLAKKCTLTRAHSTNGLYTRLSQFYYFPPNNHGSQNLAVCNQQPKR